MIRSLSDASYEMESLAEYDSRESLNDKRKLPFFFLYFAFSLKIRLVLISVSGAIANRYVVVTRKV